MSPQRQLSNFIDTILLAYVLNNDSSALKNTIIDEYKQLNAKCDDVISKIKERKSKIISSVK